MFILTPFKKYFDAKIPMVFSAVVLLSLVIIIYKLNNETECNAKEFKIDAPSFMVGEFIIFSDDSKNADSWRWYFGDNSQIAFRSKVAHSFDKEGEYLVKLVINNKCTVQRVVAILPRKNSIDQSLIPKINVPNYVMEGEEIVFEDNTDSAQSWEWRFGENLKNKVDSFDKKCSYTFTSPGRKMISLVVNDDYTHVATKVIFVMPKKEEQVTKSDRKRNTIPINPFQNVPDAPPEEDNVVKVEKGPEIGGADANKIEDVFELVTNNKISYEDFLKYFCKYNLPTVVFKDQKTTSLKEFYYQVKKEKIKLKNISIQKVKDDCIVIILIDKKYKSIF
ncbi:PKD domain-containing protein [Flavobacterium jejuense]|uniref:PKD domain-containing protein n=1 Tax=Flavobacterium jejuense TaxID=1544455 RepID=A0ABX0IVX6_9FLAO|nr:PKD domain-containing protein [Flavobacterium jejuense]NHN27618.1 PKD domain-containing protein [Flavobacterium jejuense]